MMKKMIFIVGICLLSLVLITSANAVSVSGLFNTDGTNTLLSDNSADLLINVDGSVSPIGTPTITVGDILVTITGMNTIGPTTIGSGTIYNEVTSLSAVKILTAGDVDLGPPGPDDSFGPQNINLAQYTAGPLGPGDTAYFDWSTVAGFLSNNNILFALVFEDTAQNYDRDDGIPTGITSASDGALRLAIGLIPANGDFLSVIGPFDLGAFLTIPAATAVDNSNISLDGTIIAQNWPGLNFNDNITGGNGGFSSHSASSSWPAFDNLDYTVTAVPEPSTLLLLGSGILGLGFFCRRK